MTTSTFKIHPYAQHLAGLPMHLDTSERQGALNGVDTKNSNRSLSGISLLNSSLSGDEDGFPRAEANSRYENHEPFTKRREHKRSNSSNANISSDSLANVEGHRHSRSLNKSQTTLNSESNFSEVSDRRSKSVELSQLYLSGEKDIRFTATNESVAGQAHKKISSYLTTSSTASILSRQKTIEMYKENVKKSKNPDVLFQYAQYMLQTALTMDDNEIIDQKDSQKLERIDTKSQLLKEALHYLKKLSVKGYKDAQYLLADSYSSGVFDKVNMREAFVLFQASAKHGHIEAAYRTSICFEEGLGTTRDSRKCIEFLKFAASRNHPAAMFKLGVYAFYGRMGLSNDINTKKNGLKWLSRAVAKANHLTCAAPYELAKIYETGFLDILIADMTYAIELYVQAASLGHIPSATLLGKIYEVGNEVVPQDAALSVNYYTIASHGGDPEAMLGLCAWYLVGAEPAFEADDKEAFEWALRAARLEFPKAQFTVGYFYEKGKGCEADSIKALKWYELAAANKDPRALSKLKMTDRASRKMKSLSSFNFSFLLDNEEKQKRKSFHLDFDQHDGSEAGNDNNTEPSDNNPSVFIDMSKTLNVPSSGSNVDKLIPIESHSRSETPGSNKELRNTAQDLNTVPDTRTAGLGQPKRVGNEDSIQKTPDLRPLSYNLQNAEQSFHIESKDAPVVGDIEQDQKGKSKKKKNKKGCIIM